MKTNCQTRKFLFHWGGCLLGVMRCRSLRWPAEVAFLKVSRNSVPYYVKCCAFSWQATTTHCSCVWSWACLSSRFSRPAGVIIRNVTLPKTLPALHWLWVGKSAGDSPLVWHIAFPLQSRDSQETSSCSDSQLCVDLSIYNNFSSWI